LVGSRRVPARSARRASANHPSASPRSLVEWFLKPIPRPRRENLIAVENAPVAVVNPEDWPDFATNQFLEAQGELESSLTSAGSGSGNGHRAVEAEAARG
jgi:hypothetical protein